MNIFFDHQTFAQQHYGGISRYFCELVTGINRTDQHNAHLSVLWSNNVHLHEYGFPVLSYPFPKRHRLFHKSNRLYNYLDCKIRQFDIYHATYFDDFLVNQVIPKPCITTFYDMIYERLSNEFIELSADTSIIMQKKKMAHKASHLIAISESTKRDMVELMDIPPEKISVIYLGSPFQLADTNILIPALTDGRPYLLFVGNRSGYKNFMPFLKAIAHLLVQYKIDLICAGGGTFTNTEENLFRTLSVSGLVKHKEINDIILQNLYKHAIAFIFPSLYEGFGIPVLEAFSCDCPCVVSNTSSLPEVAGDAALYIDPRRRDSMSTEIEKIILDTTLRNILKKRGKQQLSFFSWRKNVNETLNLYEKFV